VRYFKIQEELWRLLYFRHVLSLAIHLVCNRSILVGDGKHLFHESKSERKGTCSLIKKLVDQQKLENVDLHSIRIVHQMVPAGLLKQGLDGSKMLGFRCWRSDNLPYSNWSFHSRS